MDTHPCSDERSSYRWRGIREAYLAYVGVYLIIPRPLQTHTAVSCAAGTYALAKPLQLTGANSGVSWVGATGASVSGGVPVTGWTAAAPKPASTLGGGCAADYGKQSPCCGQSGNPVPPKQQCPVALPFCVDYVYNKHFGHCTAGPSPPPSLNVVISKAGLGQYSTVQYSTPLTTGQIAPKMCPRTWMGCARSGSLLLSLSLSLSLSADVRSPDDVIVFEGPSVDVKAIRHLYVNGVRATRATLPNSVTQPLFAGAQLTDAGYALKSGASSSSSRSSRSSSAGGGPRADAASFPVRPGSEFVFPQSTSPWTEPRCAVASANSTFIEMVQPCWINLKHKACGQGVRGPPTGGNYVENVDAEHIAMPGEWAVDLATGAISYALRAGESAATITAIVPVLETLVDIVGATGISFTGFTFEHATWLRYVVVGWLLRGWSIGCL